MDTKFGTIQIDLDGLWVFRSFFSREYSLEQDELFEEGLNAFLNLFERLNIKATFFVNAIDLSAGWKKRLILDIAARNHEIASHGFSHRYISELTYEQKKEEIVKSTDFLTAALNGGIYGFRAPGFNIDNETLAILEEMGYMYDSSIFPTVASPILKIYHSLASNSKDTAYSYFHMFSSLKPRYLNLGPDKGNIYRRRLIEIPVTVFPLIRMPMHFSYIITMGKTYFNLALSTIKNMKLQPNFVFHLIDLAKSKGLDGMGAFSVLKKPFEYRLDLAEHVLRLLLENYNLVTTAQLCKEYFGL